MQVSIGTKYQVVIPKEIRKKVKGLTPGKRVNISWLNESTITIKTDPKAWLERTRGMMSDAWKDIDPIRELGKMRNEWDTRHKKLANKG